MSRRRYLLRRLVVLVSSTTGHSGSEPMLTTSDKNASRMPIPPHDSLISRNSLSIPGSMTYPLSHHSKPFATLIGHSGTSLKVGLSTLCSKRGTALSPQNILPVPLSGTELTLPLPRWIHH